MRRALQKIIIWVFPELKWLRNPKYDFTKLRSWQNNVKIGKHVKINPVSLIMDSEIGDYTYISSNSVVSGADIGKFCSIGPNFLCGWGIHPTNGISTAPMFYSVSNQPNGISLSGSDKIQERKPIKIGHDVFIGANVTILDGVTIGDGAIIGAGTVVSKDIPPFAVAVGSPVSIKKYRFTEPQIEAILKIEWWDLPEDKLKDVEKMFFDIDGFISKYSRE